MSPASQGCKVCCTWRGSLSAELVGAAPADTRWTCLVLDLHYVLSLYLSRRYSHLKSIKLCSNLLVKNVCTSDLLFEPGGELRPCEIPTKPGCTLGVLEAAFRALSAAGPLPPAEQLEFSACEHGKVPVAKAGLAVVQQG